MFSALELFHKKSVIGWKFLKDEVFVKSLMDAAAIQPTPCDQSPICPEAVKLNFASMLLKILKLNDHAEEKQIEDK